MTEFMKEYIQSVRMCSYLIEPPASEVLGNLCDHIERLQKRVQELEKENNRISVLLHNEMSQLELVIDLSNKRWIALNNIYTDGEKHNANWCKRKAQEGLGIK